MQPQTPGVVLQMKPYADGREVGGDQARSAQILAVKDYLLCSLFNSIFWNCCCLGFAALVCSVKSRDRKVIGDVEGAASYGRTAKWLNIITVILTILFFAIIIALIVTGSLSSVQRKIYNTQQHNPYGDK